MYRYYLVIVNKRDIAKGYGTKYVNRFEKVLAREEKIYPSYDKADEEANKLNQQDKMVVVNGMRGWYMPYYERIVKW